MRQRVLAFGLCVALIATAAELGILVGRWTAEPRLPVVVAQHDLRPGLPIAEEDLRAVHMPLRARPPGVFHDPHEVVGRIPRHHIGADEPVRAPGLADPSGWHMAIPRGMRAMSVRVADGPALGQLLQPGATIDLLASRRLDGDTHTLLEGVLVVGVHVDDSASRLTLLVTPDQAEAVAAAERGSSLRVAVRDDDPFTVLEPALRQRLERATTVPGAVAPQEVPCRPVPRAVHCAP